MAEVGVRGVVLVQASDSPAETRTLLAAAGESALPASVVGWLPLTDPAALAAELSRYRDEPALVGVRHLIHDDPDPFWLLRSEVAVGLESLAAASLSFDVVAERPDLLDQLPTVARRHPGLTLVLDHLGKPPADRSAWLRWAEQLAAAAAEPNVVAKISGLGTGRPGSAAPASWAASVDHALAVLGAQRLMAGSDWPISTVAGDYRSMWQQTLACLAGLGETERELVVWGTAARVYHCPVPMTVKDGS